uniref:Uncharacterized protein n=1 Tax=Astyanax mexicanus TaxID=7994 RepID=A0A8B9KL18_ASTMX
ILVYHRKQAWGRMLQFEVLICKRTPVDTANPCATYIYKISSLNHEVLNHPEKHKKELYIKTFYPPEVLCSLRNNIGKQLDLHSSNFLWKQTFS